MEYSRVGFVDSKMVVMMDCMWEVNSVCWMVGWLEEKEVLS